MIKSNVMPCEFVVAVLAITELTLVGVIFFMTLGTGIRQFIGQVALMTGSTCQFRMGSVQVKICFR